MDSAKVKDIGSEAKTLDAAAILGAQDIRVYPVKVPEWGGQVFVKEMTGTERDSFEVYARREVDKAGVINVRAHVAAICLCDESGKQLFDASQMAKLATKSGRALDRIYAKALEVNALTDDEIAQLEKN